MPLYEALRLPLTVDLGRFLDLLRGLGIPCRVSEEAGEQVVRVPPELIEQVVDLYRRYPRGTGVPQPSGLPLDDPGGRLARLRHHPVAVGVLLITLVVAGLTWLGDNLAMVRWFSFVDFRIEGDYGYFATLSQTLGEGQWWRLVSPIFVHFGLLHLAMNSLWYWELGRRIESRQGGAMLAALTLGFAVASNFAQYLYGGPTGIFGGLSGVLYGLLGHCWLFQRLAPTPAYRLPPGVLAMMLVWLLICMSGVIEVVSFGTVAIANAAHLSGLLAGCVSGAIGGLLARRRLAGMP